MSTSTSYLKLLLVDDDIDFADYVGSLLIGNEQQIIHVDHVSDFERAREMVAAGDHDAYLIDHHLGEEARTGLDLIRYGQDVTVKPMIMLTSDNTSETADEAISSGASDFLQKEHASIPVIERTIRNSIVRNQRMQKVVREREIMEQRLHVDQLTGVSSRVTIERFVDKMLQECHADQIGALIYVDIDGLKPVNDLYGHAAGDQALKVISRRLIEAVGARDFIGRIGGDEFLVVGPPDTQDIFLDGTIDAMTHKLQLAISRPMEVYAVSGKCVQIRVSSCLGVVRYDSGDKDRDALISLADSAMYLDKTRKRKALQEAEAKREAENEATQAH